MIGRLSTSETMQVYLRAVGPLGVPGLHFSRNKSLGRYSAIRHEFVIPGPRLRENTCGAEDVAALQPAEVMISIAVKRPEHFREIYQADLKRVA